MKRTILERGFLVGVIFAVAIIFTVVNLAHASIVLTNPSFEDGLTGWIVVGGSASTVTQLIDGPTIYTPVHGNYFLQLVAPAKTNFFVYQAFNAASGDKLRGWAGMVSNNPTDWASVYTTIYLNWNVVWTSPVSTNGWEQWEWTAQSSGDYWLRFTFMNIGDTPSIAVYDALESFGAQVPIPTTLLLIASGLMGLVAIRRKNVHWVR
jgi:hypothetical protein